jgi:uncharacterized protein YndB with AHSA1/START domain
VQGEIVIDRPPDEVFDFVADEENEPRYNPEMRFAKKVTEGPIGVGTSFRAEMTGRGRVVPMTILFTEYDRPRRIAERVQMKAMDLTGDLTFEPFDGGTRMRWSWNLEPHGVLRFMGPLVARMGRRQEQRIWTGLKHLLEGPVA